MFYNFDTEEDTLKEELEQAIGNLSKPALPFGHPKFFKRGIKFVRAEPGSKEAGYVHDPSQGNLLVKI